MDSIVTEVQDLVQVTVAQDRKVLAGVLSSHLEGSNAESVKNLIDTIPVMNVFEGLRTQWQQKRFFRQAFRYVVSFQGLGAFCLAPSIVG